MSGGKRYYSRPVLKKLYALSHNICALPSCEVTFAKPEWPQVRARICHIAGLNEGSARYDPAMTDVERNDFPNLLLLCPNCHELIDNLEPERYTFDELMEIKRIHESHRPGDQTWCSDQDVTDFVDKLAKTLGIVVMTSDSRARPIRSGDPMPKPAPPNRPNRPNWVDDPPTDGPSTWPRGTKRVRDLAAELGLTQRSLLDICEALGLPARSKDTRLIEPYADMVRRRVYRDGPQPAHYP